MHTVARAVACRSASLLAPIGALLPLPLSRVCFSSSSHSHQSPELATSGASRLRSQQQTQTVLMQQKKQRSKGVAIEHVTLAADADSNLTLGDQVDAKKLSPPDVFADMTVLEVLQQKTKYGDMLHSIGSGESVAVALQQMAYLNIGALLVFDDQSKDLVGIFSTRDFLKRVDEQFKAVDPQKTKVGEIMTPSPVFVDSETSVLRSMEMMQSGGFRHLPVRDHHTGRCIGLISTGDLVRTLMKQYQDKSDYLEDLVSGKYPA